MSGVRWEEEEVFVVAVVAVEERGKRGGFEWRVEVEARGVVFELLAAPAEGVGGKGEGDRGSESVESAGGVTGGES